MFIRSSLLDSILVFLLACSFAGLSGCEDVPVHSSLYLAISSQIPVERLELRVRIEEGEGVLVLDPESTPSLAIEDLGGKDLMLEPYIVRVDAPAEPGVALVHITGWKGSQKAVYAQHLDLGEDTQVTVVLHAFSEECDQDGDGYLQCGMPNCCGQSWYADDASDCEDLTELAHPFSEFVCCDDADGDGFPDCDPAQDCDSTNPAVFVGATEICDGVDNDCNGEIDELAEFSDVGAECSAEVMEVTTGIACPGNRVCSADGSSTMCAFTAESGIGHVCDDGNACTKSDACSGGVNSQCVGATYSCEDEAVCTTLSCDGEGGCQLSVNGGFCYVNGSCHSDGDVDGCEVCDAAANPLALTVAPAGTSCDDSNSCTSADACEGILCAGDFVANGIECDDEEACTASEFCTDGECGNGTDPCDDFNPCTTDSCVPGTGGGCQYDPLEDGATCDDGDACTEATTCEDAGCAGGGGVICIDGNECTSDSCDSQSGCVFIELVGTPCDDGTLCTSEDTCVSGGACLGELTGPNCDDGNECTANECDPVTGCTYPNLTNTACEDGNECTANDQCAGGNCVAGGAVVCSTSSDTDCKTNQCKSDVGCVLSPANNGGPCSDGDLCTTGDLCDQGLCAGPVPKNCSDLEACTTDDCDPDTGCEYSNAVGVCSDGNPCTVNDQCSGGECVSGDLPDCSDGELCTTDVGCNTGSGDCDYAPNSLPCDDGKPCFIGDFCQGGACQQGSASTFCSDGIPCTLDSCDDTVAGGCEYTPDDAACDDSVECTLDSCSEISGCEYQPVDGSCDDGDFCTTDTCDPVLGCSNAEITNCCENASDCEDDNPCTVDSCDTSALLLPVGECVFEPVVCGDDYICKNTGGVITDGYCLCTAAVCDCPLDGDESNTCIDGEICTVEGCVTAGD